jgi:acetoacetyl-CoA synthetase
MWQPSPERIQATNLTRFMTGLAERSGRVFDDYHDLYAWSVEDLEGFWEAVWDFCGVIHEGARGPVLVDGDKMPGARFYPEVRLNFAENLLRRRDGHDAIVFWGEDKVRRRLSYAELHDLVARTAAALADLGVGEGDRVAGFMPNMPETVVAMLATASLGAIWSSCSPDFGVQGVLDRFGQIEPKVLFCPDGYYYNGKVIDSLERVRAFAPRLASLKRIVVVSYLAEKPNLTGLDKSVAFADFIAPHEAGEIAYCRVPFNQPLYIMYSSGTTGQPKCIVHGAGGTLLQHLKEHKLQCDVRRDDRVFYFTTCGWMMWNWLVSALAAEATLLLYDGSPFHPSGNILFDFIETEKGTLFGTSAKYIDACNNAGTSRPTSACRRSPAAPTSSAASWAVIRSARSGAARSRRAIWPWRSRSSTIRATRWWARRASWFASSPFPPCRSPFGTTRTVHVTGVPTSRPIPGSGTTATSSP